MNCVQLPYIYLFNTKLAMRFYLSFFLAAICCTQLFAQGGPAFNAHDLSIVWEPIQDNYQNKGQSLNAITITNNGKNTFPASGWKIFFNDASMLQPATPTNNAKIDFIDGDLFSLSPTASFGELKPGASEKVEFISDDDVVNITDGPDGFYVVWDKEPAKGYNTAGVTIKPFKPNYVGLITPATVYEQNKVVKDIPGDQLVKVFPTPVSYKETGGVFKLSDSVEISAGNIFVAEANYLQAELEKIFGKKLAFTQGAFIKPEEAQAIVLHVEHELKPGAYEISVMPRNIIIRAADADGAFYAIQSLRTLIPPSAYANHPQEILIPCVQIKDEPRFAYRGFMLDVGRNFQTKQEVYKILDLMALYKLNVFHMHLTEDEGWRLQIPGLPELTEVGGKRGHTTDTRNNLPPSHGSGGDVNNKTGTGFYTTTDFVDILRYANSLHILVVPEIEAPGHARAAVKSMEARYYKLMAEGKKVEAEKYRLADPGDKSAYSTAQYWTDNVINVSLPSTYNFVETVTDAIISMYKEAGAPLKTINWGGDEVPRGVWEKSPAYLRLQKTHPEIQSTADLWYYFYGRVNKMMQARGIYLSGWEEMALRKTKLDGKPFYIPNPDFMPDHPQAEVWNNTLGDGNEDLAYKLANAGYKTVLCPVTNLYFDMAHYKSFDEPGYYWGAFSDIDKPFSFIPYDYFKNAKVDRDGLPINRNIFIGKQRLTDYGKSNIIGLQCAVWGENIKSTERLEYMLLPRLLGFAERAWAQDPQWATEPNPAKSDSLYNMAWVNFLNVVGKRELPRLNYLDGGYSYRIPKPGVVLQDGKYYANEQFPGLTIRYTTDGTEPTAASPEYKDAVTNTGSGLKFRAFDTKGRGSNVSEPVTP